MDLSSLGGPLGGPPVLGPSDSIDLGGPRGRPMTEHCRPFMDHIIHCLLQQATHKPFAAIHKQDDCLQ